MVSRTSPARRSPRPRRPRAALLGAALLAGVAALASACKRQHDEVPCGAVAARVLAIAQAETQPGKGDETLRQRVALQLPALRDSVDASCALGNWTLEMRRCMTKAGDSAALVACQRHLDDAQRAALARAASASGAADGH
jgi:hypothetical protein